MTKEELQAAVDAVPYFYHRIELPYGIVTPGWAPINPAAYRIPDDLTGKTVLDVGAWDGYWTFEAIRRGAKSVTAIDDFSDTVGAVTNADRSSKWETFDLCANALGFIQDAETKAFRLGRQRVERYSFGIEKMSGSYKAFDAVFLFGVLYHLRHPLVALENCFSSVSDGGTIHIETAILDGCKSAYSDRVYTAADCAFEFFPNDEYGLNHSNWWVGTIRAWCGLVEAAGFKNIEHWKLTDNPKHVSEARGFIRASV